MLNCGCNSGCPPTWTPQPNCYHCPDPPQIPPCGCDSNGQPYWHELHPLIPMARFMQCGQESCLTDEQLACNMRLSELYYSTCRFGGVSYYHAIIFHALAMGELVQRQRIYLGGLGMGIIQGKESKQVVPTICNSGIFGAQLEALLEANPGGSYLIGA